MMKILAPAIRSSLWQVFLPDVMSSFDPKLALRVDRRLLGERSVGFLL